MSSKVYESTSSSSSTNPSTTPPPPPGGREHPAPHVPPPHATAGPACKPAAAGTTSGAAGPDDDAPNPAVEAFGRIKADLNELKEYASYYVAAKVDGVKRTVRNIGLYAVLGIVALIAGGAIVATAAGLLIVGLAEGLARLFGDRPWLGDLVTGILVLGAIGVAAWMMMNKLTNSWRSQTVKKYEQRKQSQRERFGHDVPQRAAESAAAAAAERREAAASGRR
jgi:hypothetical protein